MPTFLTDPLPGVEARPGDAHYAILDQGAHTLAWQPAGHRPVLWVSARSEFWPGKPVRGGVPVVFPWFGKGTDGGRSPSHGYARVTGWRRDEVAEQHDRLRVSYRLAGRDGFPSATLTADFGPERLDVRLTITNDSDIPVTAEAALHTYLAVGDIRQVSIDGFDGSSYVDTVAGADPGPYVQRGAVTFSAETDRLYRHDGAAVLHDPAWNRTITVAKTGSATTVVWNPWVEKAAAMADFGDDEWQQMVCIEAANVRDTALTLSPGATHTLGQTTSLPAA
ncbi:MAG: D-hexose-6-phosphate mutarotase [Propionibacteriaceae bacterium]|nr:D-hexose-6-phosphate mutarotase [Propionibacteriaceae bacterium]